MNGLDKFKRIIQKKYTGYRFSWEIYTDIILQNLVDKPYWLDIGAGSNTVIKEQPGAAFALGIDNRKPEICYISDSGSFCIASIYDLPIKSNSFDFITSRYLFEHLKHFTG